MIPISKPIISEREIEEVLKTLKSSHLTLGKKTEEFEKKFSEYCGTKYGVATSSGTAALHTALLSLGIGKDDEVITTPFSFIASSNSILFVGAKPVFVDIDPKTYNINPNLIEDRITDKTKAILVVHLYGQPCEMDKIKKIAKEYELFLIEDASQAHGAEYKGRKVGSFGDVACFSFYATKNMTTGEGGMIVTNSEEIAEKCRLVRNHGQEKKYYHTILGFNFRMTEMQATIGIEQLKHLDEWNERRIKNAEFFNKKLREIDELDLPFVIPGVKHVFHLYTIRVKKMSNVEFSEKLLKEGVDGRIYYPLPIHKQKLYMKLGYNDNLPNAEKASQEVVSLPVHPSLSKEDLNKVTRAVRKCLGY